MSNCNFCGKELEYYSLVGSLVHECCSECFMAVRICSKCGEGSLDAVYQGEGEYLCRSCTWEE